MRQSYYLSWHGGVTTEGRSQSTGRGMGRKGSVAHSFHAKKYLLSTWLQYKHIIIWLANFASSDWSISGPITYGTELDGPVIFAFFCFCFICTLLELVIFTSEMANRFGFDKGSFGIEIRLFNNSKRKQKSRNNYTTPKATMKIVNNTQTESWTYQFKYVCSVFKNTKAIEQAVLYKSFWLDNR